MDSVVSLEYTVEKVSEKQLNLSYRVRNESENEIFLFSPLTDQRNSVPIPVPTRVYVFPEQGSVVHLTKRLWPVPEDIEVYMPEVPMLTSVPAGVSVKETLHLPLPLIINFPYKFGDDDSDDGSESNLQADQVAFSIGYLLRDGGLDSSIEAVPGTSYFRLPYGVAVEKQELMYGELKNLKIEFTGH